MAQSFSVSSRLGTGQDFEENNHFYRQNIPTHASAATSALLEHFLAEHSSKIMPGPPRRSKNPSLSPMMELGAGSLRPSSNLSVRRQNLSFITNSYMPVNISALWSWDVVDFL
jgi:hypothetical protein